MPLKYLIFPLIYYNNFAFGHCFITFFYGYRLTNLFLSRLGSAIVYNNNHVTLFSPTGSAIKSLNCNFRVRKSLKSYQMHRKWHKYVISHNSKTCYSLNISGFLYLITDWSTFIANKLNFVIGYSDLGAT